MSITRLTPENVFRGFVNTQVDRFQQALVYNLCYVGEQVVNAARSTKSYKDQTGNLRSSVGCVVAIDGEIVNLYGFEVVKGGEAGADEGKAYAEQLLDKFPSGIVLLVVAGRNYASYVSAKGYDVLDSAELLAEKLVPEMLETLMAA